MNVAVHHQQFKSKQSKKKIGRHEFLPLHFLTCDKSTYKGEKKVEKNIAQQVLNNPKFQKMAKTKRMYCWSFSILMFVIYVIYILYIGASPESFGVPVAAGKTTTVGIYVGLFVILFAISITGIYVRQANGPLEEITQEVVREVTAANAPKNAANPNPSSAQAVDSHPAKEA